MPYIGRGPAKSGAFRILDDISGSFNGSTVTFALTVASAALTVGLPETLIIAVDGVIQEPGSAYTISGSNIVFGSAPQDAATFWGVELGDVGGLADRAITQSASNNSTKIATTAYVDAQVATEDTIAEMGDVTLSSIGSGEVLKWNGSAWINNTLAEAGILPVANPTFTGTLTVGSAAMTEADLEMLDGITAGTAAASKVVVLDSSTNITGIGTISAGAITSSGIVTGTGFTAGSAVLAEAELELLDGLTAGTAIASKVVTTDSNIDTTGQRNLTISGELDAATGDFSGAVDVAGAFSLAGTAVTSTAAELNLLDGVSGLVQADFTKLAAIDSTAAEINLLDALDRGSILYGNASGVTTVLGQGTTDQVLTSDGTDISWEDVATGAGTGPLRMSDGSASAPAYSWTSNTNMGFFRAAGSVIGIASCGYEYLRIGCGPRIFIKDDNNGEMSYGITINQAATDNETFTLKSSDVTHGITTYTESDTYAVMRKHDPPNGGLEIEGFNGNGNSALYLSGVGTTDNTTKAAAGGNGVITMRVNKKSGTGVTNPGADANLFAIREGGNFRFIWDVEGTAHADVGVATYDDYCDIELMRGMLAETVPCYRDRFGQDMMYNLCHYTDMKLIGKDSIHWEQRDCGRWQQRAMINFTGLTMLHHSTIIQMHDNLQTIIQSQEQRISQLENQVALGGK